MKLFVSDSGTFEYIQEALFFRGKDIHFTVPSICLPALQ